MTTTKFLAYLRSLDVRVNIAEGQLEVDAPQGVITPELRSELAKRKTELIAFLRKAKGIAARTLPSIRIAPRKGEMPLSFPQQRMWLMGQFELDGGVFNTPAAVRISGPLDVQALEASLNEIVRRHEVLRTSFASVDGRMAQNIAPALKLPFPVVDLRDVSKAELKDRVGQLYEEEAGRPFDLDHGPFLRVRLLREGDAEYVLIVTLHHIVSDDGSLNVFLGEMATLYAAFAAGEPSPLPELPLQYADFAVWQRGWVESEASRDLRAYWQERLHDLASVPEIPVDHPNPKQRTGNRARHALCLPASLAKTLKSLSRQEGSTLFMTLLAAYNVLLHQYTAQPDIVVAAPVAGRTQGGLEKLIGFFVNTVIMRCDLSGDPTFRQLLAQVREVSSGALAHQDLPFEEIVKTLHLDTETGHFRAFFNMLSVASQGQEISLPGLKTKPYLESVVRAPLIGGGFDWTLIAVERLGGIYLDASFNADIFEKSTIEWLLTHLHTLLESIAADPDRRLSELPQLVVAKRSHVEPAGNFERFANQEIEQSLAERFEKKVMHYPERVAVEDQGRKISYDELNRGANRLARVTRETYNDRLKLSRSERTRYARQILLWGLEGQEKLKSTTVCVAGAGGTGSPILVQLALCGVGTLIVCDGDNVELSNLNRQFLHDESRIGMNKALSAQLTLKTINPNVKVVAHPVRITSDNVYEIVGESAILLDNVDDLETKFILSECAVAKGIPHIISSMIDLSSYVAIFNPPHTPCFHCLYDRHKVDEIKTMRARASFTKRVPNPVSSPSLFASTGFACNEAIKILLGLPNPAYNKYFFFNQKGTPELVRTQGFQIITYPFSEHFKALSKAQGFDWAVGWSGKFVEEIDLQSDPHCPLCGKKAAEQGKSRFSIVIEESKPARETQAGHADSSAPAGERTVALLLGHDQEMLTGMLGVLKAGMIFVAFDASYPETRLIAMLEDSEACLIITNDENLALAKKIRNKVSKHIKVLNIRDIGKDVPEQNLGTYPRPDQVAYIVYTSGSTGKPKGVTQSHRNVLHFTMNYTNGLHIGKDDKLSLIPTFSFSAAMMDTFAALLNGATLCPYDLRQQGIAGLGQWLAHNRITIYHSVPTVFRHFVATLGDDAAFPGLRLIDFGGEPVSRADVELYKKHFPADCILVNGLGATELNVIRQFYIDKQTALVGNNVPVGHAVPDTEILLMEQGKPAGFNRPGEIVIKSKYLSPGYWQNAEQTQAAFKQAPDDTGERLYFTGDLGRLRPDGCLEHLGRKDLQVKIRGARIELAEIEGALLEIEAVREVAVVAQDNGNQSGEKALVAYIVPNVEHAQFSLEDVRSTLLGQLPAYMLPQEFVLLKALPLTATGKIDRHALPGMEALAVADHRSAVQAYVAPRTSTEKTLAEIWSQVLGVKQVGIHDSFFDLGGDSLLALRVIDKIRQACLHFTSQQVFYHNTIAELAALEGTAEYQTVREPAGLYSADTAGGKDYTGTPGPIPIIPATFWCKEELVYGNWWQFFEWLLEVPQALTPVMLQQVVRGLIRQHEALRLRMVPDETSPLGIREFIVDPDNDQAEYWLRRDLSGLMDAEQEKVILDSIDGYWTGMSTAQGPTFKFVLFDLGPDKLARLLIMVHHFAADAYSIMILMEDFNTACRQVLSGKSISLPPSIITLREWVGRMYEYARSDAAQREIDYHRSLPWSKVKIPLDYPDVPVSEAKATEFTVSLDAEETQILLRQVPAAYDAGIVDVLLTGFLIAAGNCWGGLNTLAFEMFDNNRHMGDDMDLSRLVGFIGHTHDEVLSIEGAADPVEALRSVREQRARIPNNGISWQWINIHKYIIADASFIPHMPYDFIRFNYLGQQTGRTNIMRTFPLPPHKAMTKEQKERARLECWASVTKDKFMLKWKYYTAYHKPATVNRLSREYLDALRFFIKKSDTNCH